MNLRKNFSKEELENFMLVVLRDGEKLIVCDDIIIDENHEFLQLSSYNNELLLNNRNNNKFDIMEIYIPKNACHRLTFDLNYRDCIWKREETKEMTLSEICNALGYNIKIIKDKE